MQLTVVARENGLCKLECSGTITAFVLPGGGELWKDALGPDGFAQTVLLDLSQVDYMDSSGVSWLIVAHKRFRQAGGRFILHSLMPRLEELVEILHLSSILDIVADEPSALALLQKANS